MHLYCIFKHTFVHILADSSTLRSLLNELARLTVFSTVKQASSFNRDLRVDRRKFEFNYVWIQFQFAENILSFRLSFLQSFLSRKEKLLLPAVPKMSKTPITFRTNSFYIEVKDVMMSNLNVYALTISWNIFQ